jgi:DNA helicase-2/ATP-dependent DNA helicase PcrA
MAKGLEFDQVIVPDVSEKNYSTEMDRNMLYVACTRAMHHLALTYVGATARFLGEETPSLYPNVTASQERN